MRDIKEPQCQYDVDIYLEFEEFAGKKVKEILYFDAGAGLQLIDDDVKTLNNIIETAFEMHEIIGPPIIKLANSLYIEYCFPISKSCYEEIKRILLDPQRIRSRYYLWSKTTKKLNIVHKNVKYLLSVGYFIRTEDDQYFVFLK